MSDDTTVNVNDDRIDQLLALVSQISTRLFTLETTVDQRLRDTRPILSIIEKKLEDIDTRLKKVENDISASRDSIENRLDEIEKVAIKTRSDMLDVRTDFRALRAKIKERFPDLEISFTPGVQ